MKMHKNISSKIKDNLDAQNLLEKRYFPPNFDKNNIKLLLNW